MYHKWTSCVYRELFEKKGIKSLLIKQLSRKLGEIPELIQQQINQLSMDSLEALSENLFDLNTLEDLSNWLNN